MTTTAAADALVVDDQTASTSTEAASAALARWELENGARDAAAGAAAEAWFAHDAEAEKALLAAKPWASDPRYFKRVHISALALLKMAMHAKSGGNLEVMGMLSGRAVGDSFVVLDCFALPVVGTETRVNAQSEANEYMIDYLEASKSTGFKSENLVGWYHSHPGYGCWLSGIDVGTQTIQQQYNEPFLAVVVDPHRTAAAGRVELGAFRCYPEGYVPPKPKRGEEASSSRRTVPLSKVEDFGVHADRYYSLETSVFKSPLDAAVLSALWKRYWGASLAAPPSGSAASATASLAAGAAGDVSRKLAACCEAASSAVASARGGGGGGAGGSFYFGGGGGDFVGLGGGGGGGGSRRLARLMAGGGGGVETPPAHGGERAAPTEADEAAAAAAATAAAAAEAARLARAASKRPPGEEEKLASAAGDAARLAAEQAKLLASGAVRASLFSSRRAPAAPRGDGGAAPMDS